MRLHEGSGDVIEKNIRLWASAAAKITAVHHKNTTDIWVIAPGLRDNTFHAYLVTASGVNPTPVISQTGIVHLKNEFDFTGYLKASPNGRKLALSVFDPGFFELFNFDHATGTVSHPIFLGEYEAAYGVEFSPDSTKLYGTVVSWVDKKIYQFDMDAGDIPGSAQVIGESSEDARLQGLQVAPDGRVYLVRENTGYLGVINYPNRLGTASEYVDEGVYLEGRTGRDGFPNFVQSFFVPPLIEVSIQDATVNETDNTLVFTVSLSELSRSDVSVNYATNDGTATAGSDYASASGTLTIPEGALSGTIKVNIIDDEVFDEGHETFTIDLSNPVRAILADHQGIGIIQDNDLVKLSIEDTTADEKQEVIQFTVNLSAGIIPPPPEKSSSRPGRRSGRSWLTSRMTCLIKTMKPFLSN